MLDLHALAIGSGKAAWRVCLDVYVLVCFDLCYCCLYPLISYQQYLHNMSYTSSKLGSRNSIV